MICSSHWLSHRAWLHRREQFLPSHHWCSRTLGLFQTAYFQAHFISCLWFNHLEKKSGEWRPTSGPRGLGEAKIDISQVNVNLFMDWQWKEDPRVHWCWLGPCAAAGGISFFWLPTLDKRKKNRSQLDQKEEGTSVCHSSLAPKVNSGRNSQPGNQQADLGLSQEGVLTVQRWPSNKAVSTDRGSSVEHKAESCTVSWLCSLLGLQTESLKHVVVSVSSCMEKDTLWLLHQDSQQKLKIRMTDANQLFYCRSHWWVQICQL